MIQKQMVICLIGGGRQLKIQKKAANGDHFPDVRKMVKDCNLFKHM
jgi:hypothetical protein